VDTHLERESGDTPGKRSQKQVRWRGGVRSPARAAWPTPEGHGQHADMAITLRDMANTPHGQHLIRDMRYGEVGFALPREPHGQHLLVSRSVRLKDLLGPATKVMKKKRSTCSESRMPNTCRQQLQTPPRDLNRLWAHNLSPANTTPVKGHASCLSLRVSGEGCTACEVS